MSIRASVIIPTHNRHDKLSDTVARLNQQSIAHDLYEVIVVDDGSDPAVALADFAGGPLCRLIRLEGVERSAARNRGAAEARGEVLIFIDDDISVESGFVAAHLSAHKQGAATLAVGQIRLSDELLTTPFGRFRQKLELRDVPERPGAVAAPNFCTAANMSMTRHQFHKLGGFDSALVSSEDQDLALRHTALGGQIVFVPDAMTIHHDNALDIRSYCRRAEWGMEKMMAFCRRYPDWPDNVERERINGPLRPGSEPLRQTARKAIKLALSSRPAVAVLFAAARLLERVAPRSLALDRVYRLLLGAHILRGYRRGQKRFAIDDQQSEAALGYEPTANPQHSGEPAIAGRGTQD